MTYEEMSKFTYEELSKFTNYELSLESTKLLCKILENENNNIPQHILDKLQIICQKTIDYIEESTDTKVPKEIKESVKPLSPITQKALEFAIKYIVKFLIKSLIAYGITSVVLDGFHFDYVEETTQTITYISSGDFNNDITVVIEEIETIKSISLESGEINVNIGRKK